MTLGKKRNAALLIRTRKQRRGLPWLGGRSPPGSVSFLLVLERVFPVLKRRKEAVMSHFDIIFTLT